VTWLNGLGTTLIPWVRKSEVGSIPTVTTKLTLSSMVEQHTHNVSVIGSNPVGSTNYISKFIMKQIIILFLVLFLISCGDESVINGNPIRPVGEIIEMRRLDSTVFILVEFKNSNNILVSYWIYGSDTCKIGQKVTLR
jgi:hypothetical protein